MEIKVENQIVMKKISEIKPYVRNPRKNEKTVDLLIKIIPKVGFNVPIVIDKNGIIVKGHARYAAAIKLDMHEVPCIVTHADEDAIKADRLADNKISEFSEWVNDELMHELDMISFDIDFSDFGFPTFNHNDVPAFFDDYDDAYPSDEIDEEKKQELYRKFLEEQSKDSYPSITNEKAIEKAVEEQINMANKPIKYCKCVCEKCGHIMFVNPDSAVEI